MSNFIKVNTELLKEEQTKLSQSRTILESASNKAMYSVGIIGKQCTGSSMVFRGIINSTNNRISSTINNGITELGLSISMYESADNVIKKTTDTIEKVKQITNRKWSNKEANEKINEIDLNTKIHDSIIQIRQCDKNGHAGKDSGRCNVSALTNLLNRKYVLDSRTSEPNKYFTPEDVFKVNGCTNIIDFGITSDPAHPGQHYYYYEGKSGTGNWYNNKTYSKFQITISNSLLFKIFKIRKIWILDLMIYLIQ